MGHGGRAVGMIVMAVLLLGGIGWGVDRVVRRVQAELPRPTTQLTPAPNPPPAPQPAAADRADPAEQLRREMREAIARSQAALDAARRGAEPLPVGGNVTKPAVIEQPPPDYTEEARRARIQGVVILEATIDREGRVVDTRVLKGLPLGLSEAAEAAVAKWRYRPAALDGEPVPVIMIVTVNFQLQ